MVRTSAMSKTETETGVYHFLIRSPKEKIGRVAEIFVNCEEAAGTVAGHRLLPSCG
jgi:hypothetical protein